MDAIEDMTVNPDFLKARLLATETFQTDVAATWVWAKKSVATWGDHRTSFGTMLEDQLRIQGSLQLEGPGMEADLTALHTLTVQSIRLARSYYADQPVILQRLSHLAATSQDRHGKVQDALELEVAWEALPEADRDRICTVTLAQFKAKRLAAAARLEALTKLENDEVNLRVDLHALANKLWDDCKAWYMAALVVFPAETPEGQKLRAGIPTQDTGETQPSVETTTPVLPPPDPVPGGTPSG